MALASLICSANCAGSRAQSNSGSEPNCKARVTNFAFGFESKDLKRLSRRVFQIFGSSQPNQINACTPRPLSQAASITSSLLGYETWSGIKGVGTLLVVGFVTNPIQTNVACFESFPNVRELRVQLALVLACVGERLDSGQLGGGGLLKHTLCNLVTEPDECVLRTAVAPPPIQRTRRRRRHLEVKSREARPMRASGWFLGFWRW